MSLSDNKRDVFTTIGAYTSLNQNAKAPSITNKFSSINNKKDAVPFLLDVLKVVVGSAALQNLVGKFFTGFVDKAEPKIKTSVKKQAIQHNSGDAIPSYFNSAGISVPVKNIDIYGKYKTSPSSTSGSLLYDKSKPNFDSAAHQAIVNAGTDTIYNNIIINYNSTSDSFTFKSNPAKVNSSTTIGSWVNDFVDNSTFINQKEFQSTAMNAIYGSITSNQNKSIEETYKELQISKKLENLINGDDSFEISPNDNDDLLQKAQQLVEGVIYYDMGCGRIGASLPLSGLTNLISQISGSTDAFAVGNAVENTISQSSVESSSIVNENKATINDGFFQRLIKAISLILTQAVTVSPQIRALMAIVSAFSHNGQTQISDPNTDLKKSKDIISCLTKDITSMINEFIFNLVVSFLIVLLTPIIKKIIKEKINQYVGIIKSLVS